MEKENLAGTLLFNLMWLMEKATNWLASHFPSVFQVRGQLGVWKFSSSSEVVWCIPWGLSLFFTGLSGNLKSSPLCCATLWLFDALLEGQTWGLCGLFWFYSWTPGPELKKGSIKGCCCCQSPEAVSNSLWPMEMQHARLLCPHSLLEFAQIPVHWVDGAI